MKYIISESQYNMLNEQDSPYMSELNSDENKYKEELDSISEEYREILERREVLLKKVAEIERRVNPQIYLGTAKHHSSKKPYIVARSPWRKGTNDYAHLRVYVGSLENFDGGINDPQVKAIALKKIQDKINQLFPYSKS